MKKRVLNLILGTGLLLLASCAGKKHYEWIKIKPPGTSNEYIAHSTIVKSVDILVRLTEKANYQYIADSRAFFAKYPLSDSGELTDKQIKNKVKPTFKTSIKKNDFVYKDEGFPPSKLNNAMIFPQKSLSDKVESTASDSGFKKERKNLSIKELFPDYNNALTVDDNPDKKGGFMWAGLILVIIGILSGLIFGRYTYLISVGGVLLIMIGYYLRM